MTAKTGGRDHAATPRAHGLVVIDRLRDVRRHHRVTDRTEGHQQRYRDSAIVEPAATSLTGTRVVVTAGPTYEDIDPVRYVGNRSSGRMGFALAAEARRRGAEVTLIAGPTTLSPPPVDATIAVRSAADMHEAVMRVASNADVVIMAAAVADYAPAAPAAQKVTKTDGPLTLTLQRTKDILSDLGSMRAGLGGDRPVLVGFAAETQDLLARAREKRVRKKVDLIVANDVSKPDQGFDADTNAVTIIGEGDEQVVPLQSKARVAAVILDRVEHLLRSRTGKLASR